MIPGDGEQRPECLDADLRSSRVASVPLLVPDWFASFLAASLFSVFDCQFEKADGVAASFRF